MYIITGVVASAFWFSLDLQTAVIESMKHTEKKTLLDKHIAPSPGQNTSYKMLLAYENKICAT